MVERGPALEQVRQNPGIPLPLPPLDDRTYQDLLDEVLARIPVHAPEWTDFNESDPGVTLVEFLAFLAETLLWQIGERQRKRHRRRRVALLVVGAAGLGALWGASKLVRSNHESCRDERPA